MSIYRPTWLYIKQHNQTGLKYFGKTTRTDPYEYLGSGKYWKRHLAKHGDDVTTLWCYQYDNEQLLTEEAIAFSVMHDIVDSLEWANLKIETGIDGGANGPISNETRAKMSAASRRKYSELVGIENSKRQKEYFKNHTGHMTGKRHSDETKSKISESEKGKFVSQETRAKISAAGKGRITKDSTREKLRNKVISPETRAKLAEASRRVWATRKLKN